MHLVSETELLLLFSIRQRNEMYVDTNVFSRNPFYVNYLRHGYIFDRFVKDVIITCVLGLYYQGYIS